jgi:hypothetical protein
MLITMDTGSEPIGNILDHVIREGNRYFLNKNREYMKDKIRELETNSKNKNIKDLYRGTDEFKKG